MAGCFTPPRKSRSARAASVVISSQGLKALNNDGSTSRTASQKAEPAGSKRSGPQVVMASTPPGRTSRHISATNPAISGAKNTPNTQITASKLASGSPVRVASP